MENKLQMSGFEPRISGFERHFFKFQILWKDGHYIKQAIVLFGSKANQIFIKEMCPHPSKASKGQNKLTASLYLYPHYGELHLN